MPPARDAAAATRQFETFRRQECNLILLNLGILATTLLLQVVFKSLLEWPSRLFLLLFCLRFLWQFLELSWLSARSRYFGPRAQAIYSHLAIALHLAFAAVLCFVSTQEDTHFTVLLILPVVAAGFRSSAWGAIALAAAAGSIALLDVWFSYGSNPDVGMSEYFEAIETGMLFLVVGVLVWMLVNSLHKEERRLAGALRELEQTRDRLIQQEKLAAIGRIAGAVAHEIRNPIAMISSSLSMAGGGPQDGACAEMFSIARQEAARLERFMNEFLSYTRNRNLNLEAANVADTLRYLVGVARAKGGEKAVQIDCECIENQTIVVDPFQLHQAMLNLILNAIDASPPGGRIVIGCEFRDGAWALIYVENQGEAIPDDVAARLFEPFFTTKPEGTGLGLAIATTIVEAHQGELVLAGNRPGCVRFEIRLPLAPASRVELREG